MKLDVYLLFRRCFFFAQTALYCMRVLFICMFCENILFIYRIFFRFFIKFVVYFTPSVCIINAPAYSIIVNSRLHDVSLSVWNGENKRKRLQKQNKKPVEMKQSI